MLLIFATSALKDVKVRVNVGFFQFKESTQQSERFGCWWSFLPHVSDI